MESKRIPLLFVISIFLCTFDPMKLSVVIPVYGVEDTLGRCVRSVLRQAVDEMEVILVDDGSPDRCPQLCDEWARQDARIHVIHQQNGGLSSARNTGINAAQGEFITFVDSDDWLEDDTYPALLPLMPENDIVEYSIADRLTLIDASYTDMKAYWLEQKAYRHTYAWNKIYRRSLFNDVRYPKGKVFEDVYTLPLLLRKARRLSTTSLGSYHYEWNPAGITATADGEAMAQLLHAHLTSGMPVDDSYYMYLVNIQMDVWELTGNPVTLPSRNVNISILNGKSKIKAIFVNTLGINTLCRINKYIHKIRKPARW